MIKLEDILKIDDKLEIVKGDGSLELSTISNLDKFTPHSIVFVGAKKYLEKYFSNESFDSTQVVILDKKFWESLDEVNQTNVKNSAKGLVLSANFSVSISKISKPFYDLVYKNLNFQVDGRKLGTASIHPSVKLGENVFIGENVEIEADCTIMPGVTILPNVKVKANTIIFPNVTIYPFTEIGEGCRIHAGTTIGSDGFGYNHEAGVHLKVWHFGGVCIQNNVEIGSNVSVDQGTFSPTLIGAGTKIDNLVQVGHNVQIGPGVILCGQVGMAGSAKVGAYSVFGGKAAIGDGVELGSGAQVAGACMVTSSWPDGAKLGGHPARPLKEWMRGLAFVRKGAAKK